MDTTIRLNLLLIILISAICGLVIKETLYDKSVLAKEAASGHAGKPRQNNSNVRSDSESLLIEKILSLKNSDKYDPDQARPDNLDAAPLQNPVPHIHGLAQDRLYKGAGQSAASFTMENRGKWMALPAGFTQATT
ncbi:MAG: hypothetical protein LBG46_00750, partial [Elusimicrobiota bacterium]|nr:hypothetical protein [Elusimicrobiota bacterium]